MVAVVKSENPKSFAGNVCVDVLERPDGSSGTYAFVHDGMFSMDSMPDCFRNCDCESDLIIEDAEAHCPREDCDWWVPEGMEYLYHRHWEQHE